MFAKSPEIVLIYLILGFPLIQGFLKIGKFMWMHDVHVFLWLCYLVADYTGHSRKGHLRPSPVPNHVTLPAGCRRSTMVTVCTHAMSAARHSSSRRGSRRTRHGGRAGWRRRARCAGPWWWREAACRHTCGGSTPARSVNSAPTAPSPPSQRHKCDSTNARIHVRFLLKLLNPCKNRLLLAIFSNFTKSGGIKYSQMIA